MLVKTNATSVQQLKNQLKEWQNIEEIVDFLYVNNTNPQKRHPLSMKSFDEFGVENRKIVLIGEYPCQNRSQPEKKEGEYIENDKNCLSKCIVGRTRKEGITMSQESITSKSSNSKTIFQWRILKNTIDNIVRKN